VTAAGSRPRCGLRQVATAVGLALVVMTVWARGLAAQTTEPSPDQTTGQTTETTLSTYPTISTVTTVDPCRQRSAPIVCDTASLDREAGSGTGPLPFSGGDAALVTVLGLGAVGAGAAIVLLSRRRSTGT